MPKLTDLQPIDHARAGRLLLAWHHKDEAALRYTITEADNADPTGGAVTRMVFALLDATVSLLKVLDPAGGGTHGLERSVAHFAAAAERNPELDDEAGGDDAA